MKLKGTFVFILFFEKKIAVKYSIIANNNLSVFLIILPLYKRKQRTKHIDK